MKLFIALHFIALIAVSFGQQSTPDSPSYNAAVIEFSYERNESLNDEQTTQSNWNQYLDIMTNIPQNTDIVVFPEMTLNKMTTAFETPEPSARISPCDDSSSANLLKLISCSAKNFRRYVVVNAITKARCPDAEMIENKDPRNCSARPDGFSYYNTNLVFDRTGVIISRYRKFNLFGEQVDKPFKPTLQTFETDFGVTFGHFICFDMMFRSPAVELARSGITDIIFATMWFSELPFLTAVQVQQNWAYVNNVNLLASGANNHIVGSTGSGIYAGRKGSISSVMEGSHVTRALTGTVPKRIPSNENVQLRNNAMRYTKQQMSGLKLKRDQLDRYAIKFLKNPEVGSQVDYSEAHCHNDFCCDFNLTYRAQKIHENHYEYAMAVYHGNRTFDGFADGGVVACTIIACQNRNISTCGVRNEELENNFYWQKIEIKGRFPNKDGQFLYLPTSLDTSILPLQPTEFTYEASYKPKDGNENADFLDIAMNFEGFDGGSSKDLLAFGIYGRDFNLDNPNNGGNHTKVSKFFMILSAIVLILCKNLV